MGAVAARLAFGVLAAAERYPLFSSDFKFQRSEICPEMGAIAERLRF
jgi:hypothetical protein